LQRALDEAVHKVNVQASVAAKARINADQNIAYVDQMTEYTEVEKGMQPTWHIMRVRK